VPVVIVNAMSAIGRRVIFVVRPSRERLLHPPLSGVASIAILPNMPVDPADVENVGPNPLSTPAVKAMIDGRHGP
jgi:hypothetical protein